MRNTKSDAQTCTEPLRYANNKLYWPIWNATLIHCHHRQNRQLFMSKRRKDRTNLVIVT
jgi:hypothetical protein